MSKPTWDDAKAVSGPSSDPSEAVAAVRDTGGRTTPLRIAAVSVLWVAVLFGAVVVAARALGWQFGPLYYLVALVPYVGVMLLVLGVISAGLRRWLLAVLSACLAVLVAVWWAPAFIGTQSGQGQRELTVMTLNMEFGRASPEAIVDTVTAYDVDVLSVQELTAAAVEGLQQAGVEDQLPHSFVQLGRTSRAGGAGLWSRYSMSNQGRTDGLRLENIVAAVQAPGGAIDVFAVHPLPPSPTDGTLGAEAQEVINNFLNSRSGPRIAAGDFNATIDNVPLRRLLGQGWVDSATAAGTGMVRTWPSGRRLLPPLVAIDHVLTRDLPTARHVSIVDVPQTDHRAVIASL